MTAPHPDLPRILIVIGEPVSERLAGPAIRAWEIATILHAEGHAVTIASLRDVSRRADDFEVVEFGPENAEALVDASDVVLFQGGFYASMPWLRDKPQVQVMDLYDPFHLEFLHRQHGMAADEVDRVFAELTTELNAQLSRADLVLCASDRQRDLWIGQLAALGRVRPPRAGSDPAVIDELVRIVPFGVPDAPFAPARRAVRGIVPGIEADDFVLIWGGGIYDWFDPLTLIRAVDRARADVPHLRLFFMAKVHPNAGIDGHAVPDQAVALAKELGIYGTHVVFNEEWVAYDDRAAYLADADLGVTTHNAGLETRFSFRTRNLDYVWAGLPLITTEGDVFEDLILRHGFGTTVPVGDVDALATAIVAAAGDSELRARWSRAARELAATMTWRTNLAPLVEFCRDPRRAAVAPWNLVTAPPAVLPRTRLDDVRTAARLLRTGGPALVVERLQDRRRRSALARVAVGDSDASLDG
ncbi:glycosyltransferase family 4 protein [Frigoribacterium sp. VKM Ac-2530]|uniref:glycosyltransferase family 4 protein n=1 Tax=Frigoribacterium sp. VKM Ac-2530 TaxID=2783822 RepID=UPI00188ACDF1|nr:glycosyltransferase family 4 protein [Frigoribacterium sp. VKM Ac-2530]MBF4578840.1 glycosyltransferase family 4 protein [Frigoribacterium sp. VKM Ac-2530]